MIIIVVFFEKVKLTSMVHDHIDLRHIHTLIEKCRILIITSIFFIVNTIMYIKNN